MIEYRTNILFEYKKSVGSEMINKVGANVLFVEDLDQCMKFYRDILSLEVVFTDEDSVAYRMDDQDFLLLKVSAAVEMIGEEAVSRDHKSGQHILLCADVEDVDTVYHTLIAKGVAFIRAPMDQSWGLRTAYFADPEGHVWEIRHSLRTAPQG